MKWLQYWTYSEHTLDTLWTHSEHTLNTLSNLKNVSHWLSDMDAWYTLDIPLINPDISLIYPWHRRNTSQLPSTALLKIRVNLEEGLQFLLFSQVCVQSESVDDENIPDHFGSNTVVATRTEQRLSRRERGPPDPHNLSVSLPHYRLYCHCFCRHQQN